MFVTENNHESLGKDITFCLMDKGPNQGKQKLAISVSPLSC